MSTPIQLPRIALRARVAALVCAATFVLGITSALLLAFHGASPARWLLPTPDVLESVASCEQQATRRERDTCKQAVVAMRARAASSPQRLATR
jgi:hypothetical protein